MKYISSALAVILTILSLFSPILVVLWMIEILWHFSFSFEDWRTYTDLIRIPTHHESLSFSPAQYLLSLEWVQHLIISSGYPTIMGFLVPILVYLMILLIAVFLLYILFLTFFWSIAVFLIFLRSIPSILFHLSMKVIRGLWSMVFWNNPLRAFWIWISTYVDFLIYYWARWNSLRILKTHIEFLSYLFRFQKLPIQWELYHILKSKYEDRNLVISFNIVLRRIFSSQDKQYPYVASLYRSKGELWFTLMRWDSGKTISELKRVSENEADFTVEMGDGLFKMMSPKETKDGLEVKIIARYDWKIQTKSPIEFENLLSNRKHGDIPMGFFPQVSQWVVSYETYFVSLKDFGHLYIGAKSTAWKDALVRSWVLATLIKSPYRKGYIVDPKDDKFEIVFIDTKFSDASYLSSVPWCKRVLNDSNQVPLALENAVNELQRRLESFWLLGNISQWNKKHTYEEKYSHQYIFINEINDLLSTLPKGKGNGDIYGRTVRAMRTLLNRWLAWGFHVVLQGQSLRKEGSELGSLLTNTWRIIGAMGNEDEARMALKSHYKDYWNIQKYNFVYIQDSGEAKQVFRPYLTSQEEISEWIDKNFDRQEEMRNYSTGSDGVTWDDEVSNSGNYEKWDAYIDEQKKFSYLADIDLKNLFRDAIDSKVFPRELAMKYGIPEKKFPIFKNLLSELNILTIREGMTAKFNPNLSLEDILQKIENFITNNQ